MTTHVATHERSPLEHCLFAAFARVLRRHGLTLRVQFIGHLRAAPVRTAMAGVWEMAFHGDDGPRARYAAWVTLVPGAVPDLLDLIAPSTLERPGAAPRFLTDPDALSADLRWPMLRTWAGSVQRHDALQALLAALTPDAPTAARLYDELVAAAARCDLAVPAQD
jgi:hypothetical protein